MWTPRDWFFLSAAALATCSLTLIAFSPSALIAADAPPAAGTIDTPTFHTDTASVTAALAPTDSLLETRGPVTFIKPGKMPALHVTAVNNTDAAITLPLHLAIDLRTTADRFSRVPRVNTPKWSQDYALNLQAHEQRTFDVAPALDVPAGASLHLLASQTPPANAPKTLAVSGMTLVSLIANPPPATQPAVAMRDHPL